MKYIYHNKSLMDRYEKLRIFSLRGESHNMEQEYFIKNGMIAWTIAWSDRVVSSSLKPLKLNNNQGIDMPVENFLNQELKQILVNIILAKNRS